MISTRGRYALRVMLDLAENNSDGYVPLNEIATRQDISIKYLESILKKLVDAELLKGHRGKGGGYKLTRTPSEIPVGEIIEITEGNLAPVACLGANSSECPRKDKCTTLPLWTRYDTMVRDFFYGITLQDILDENSSVK